MTDTTIGASLILTAEQANASVKSFKQELKEAQAEVVTLTDKFGATSKEAVNAAKRAAELKDRIGDAKKLVDSFNPDEKFRGFSQALTGVAGGFSAVTGAMGLLGIQSEDVQKSLLKVQSALALSQGLNTIGDSIQSVKNLGAQLVATLGKSGLIGIAIAGVGLLTAALVGVFDTVESVSDRVSKAVKSAFDEANKQTAGQVEQLKILYEISQDVTQSLDTRRDATKKLTDINEENNKVTGESNVLLLDQNGVLAAQPDLIDKIAASMVRVAKTKAYLNLIEKAYTDVLTKQNESLESQTTNVGDFLSFLDAIIFGGGGASARQERLKQSGVDDAQKYLDGLEKKFTEGLKDKSLSLDGSIGVKPPPKLTTGKKEPEFKGLTDQQKQDLDNQLNFLQLTQLNERRIAEENKALKIEDQEEILDLTEANQIDQTLNEKAQSDLRIGIAKTEAADKIALAQAEKEAKIMFAQQAVVALGALSELAGRQTIAGKILAIAAATIDTYAAAAKTLRAYSGVPVPGFAIAQVIATIATGLIAVRNIIKVPVPGGGGGGSAPSQPSISTGGITAPLQPQVSNTLLDQQSLNASGNAAEPIRTFVVEADVSGAQERITRLNRAARLTG